MKIPQFPELINLLTHIESKTHNGRTISFEQSVSRINKEIHSCKKKENKIMIVGNGGSASIASHISTDLLKNAKIPSLAFLSKSTVPPLR